MTKNQILAQLLTDKGHQVTSIWYEPTFGHQPGGWTATISEKDEYGDEVENAYDLGKDFGQAKTHIENNNLTRID